MSNQTSFQDLVQYHEDLMELFFQHQKALLEKEVEVAKQHFQAYKKALERHIRDEEEVLMPVYEGQAKIPTGGDPRHFKGDHRNLLSLLAEYEPLLKDLDPSRNDWHKQLLHILDEENRHKRLLEHHDQREQSLFFAALDQATNETERRALMDQCSPRIQSVRKSKDQKEPRMEVD